MAPDRIDRQLLALLQDNARASTAALARALGIARTTVHERIARLERSGVICGYSVVLSRDPFENQVRAAFIVDVEQPRRNLVVQKLKLLPEIKTCHTTSGGSDLLCLAETPLLEDFEALEAEISLIQGVVGLRALICTALKFDRRPAAGGGPSVARVADLRRGEAG